MRVRGKRLRVAVHLVESGEPDIVVGHAPWHPVLDVEGREAPIIP